MNTVLSFQQHVHFILNSATEVADMVFSSDLILLLLPFCSLFCMANMAMKGRSQAKMNDDVEN